MIEVLIEKPGLPVRAVRLGGGVYVIGRHEGCEIQLDDKEVSRRHARLLVDGEEIVVEDLESGNGTFLEGKAVQQKMLRHGDVVEIVPYQLRIRTGVKAEAAPARAWLEIVDGPGTGTRFELKDDAMGIGRAEDQHIRLPDQGASRSHAMVFRKGDGWAIRDNGSVNGVLLGDRKIDEADLGPGAEVVVGNTRLRFELEDGSPAVEPWHVGAHARTNPGAGVAVTPPTRRAPVGARPAAEREPEGPAVPPFVPPKVAPAAAPPVERPAPAPTPPKRKADPVPQTWYIAFLLVVTSLIACAAVLYGLKSS